MYLKTLPLLFLSGTLFCQESPVASGGDVSGMGGSMSYSIGLIDYRQTDVASGSVYEGVQQPYELFSVGLEEWDDNVSISAYPNPMTSQLTIAFPDEVLENMRFTLTDESGRVIQNGLLDTKETVVDVMPLARANYFLTVYKKDQSVRVYKLVKN
ncbi:MAG: T9SS type A sorting domain-containing protein [Flavobacteriia bacterium]|nr:T9SS type A sorting domain-containing protein [Flavobacteriia bacterium]